MEPEAITVAKLKTEESPNNSTINKDKLIEPLRDSLMIMNETRNSMEKSQGSTESKRRMNASDKIMDFMARQKSAKARKDEAIKY